MSREWTRLLLTLLMLVCLAGPAPAVMLDEADRPTASDPDFAAGMAAFGREDWDEVVLHIAKVLERRPWHDEAHNRIGFAYRKLGRFDVSLSHYHRALQLNPHNRGALEYLGEAYLELGDVQKARDVLELLETECRRIWAAGGPPWQDECEEWRDLVEAFDTHAPEPGGPSRPKQ